MSQPETTSLLANLTLSEETFFMTPPKYANSSNLDPHPSFSSSPTQGKGTL